MTEEKKEESYFEEMTDEQIKTLAIDICEGKIFGDWMIPGEDNIRMLATVFVPLMFVAGDEKQKDSLKEVGNIYQYLTEAQPRSVNGYPVFMSMKVITKKDQPRVMKAIEEYRELKEKFMDKEKEVQENDG